MNTILFSFVTLASLGLQHQDENCTCQAMPSFSVKATNGKTYTQASLTAQPSVLVFLASGCPHNPKAVPDLNRLAGSFGDKVTFVAVTSLSPDKAKAYAKELGLKVPLLCDTNKTVTKGFGAKHSLDFALVCAKDKKIAKVWSGYDRATIQEIVTSLPTHGGPKLNLDLSAYPAAKQSGCGL